MKYHVLRQLSLLRRDRRS